LSWQPVFSQRTVSVAILGRVIQAAGVAIAALAYAIDYVALFQAQADPTMGGPPASPWLLMMIVVLLGAGLASPRSRWGGVAATLAALVTAWYGVAFAMAKPPEFFGTSAGVLIVVGASISLVGIAMGQRLVRSARGPDRPAALPS
jgi:hypothetical protein